MKTMRLAIVCALAVFANTASAAVTFEYVGSFAVADGPLWTTNPRTYTGQEAAALVFGGNPGDYALSTSSSRNAATITYSNYVDGWGVNYEGGPRIETIQNFKAGTNYNERAGVVGSAYSAYVFDHACGQYYCAPGGGENAVNHVWRAEKTPEISERALSVLNTLLGALQSTADGWINAIIDYQNGAGLGALANFLREVEPSIGQGLSRIGGVVINGLQGLLDPAVAQGVKAIYDQWKDPEHILNENERNILRQIDCMENPSGCSVQPKPLQPSDQTGNTSHFKTYVNPDQVLTIDPELAYGFEYASLNGGPRFASVITPYLGEFQHDYEVQILQNGIWTGVGSATPLSEFFFAVPVDAFRVVGISEQASLDPSFHPTWVTGLSFEVGGEFTGTLTGLAAPETSVPLPGTLALLGIGLTGLVFGRRRNTALHSEPLLPAIC